MTQGCTSVESSIRLTKDCRVPSLRGGGASWSLRTSGPRSTNAFACVNLVGAGTDKSSRVVVCVRVFVCVCARAMHNGHIDRGPLDLIDHYVPSLSCADRGKAKHMYLLVLLRAHLVHHQCDLPWMTQIWPRSASQLHPNPRQEQEQCHSPASHLNSRSEHCRSQQFALMAPHMHSLLHAPAFHHHHRREAMLGLFRVLEWASAMAA